MIDVTSNNLGEKNPYRYRSYYYDTETSWYYLNSRYYDPLVGRFITMDEIEYLGATSTIQSYNLFTYCEGNPVMGYDPMGTWDWNKILAISTIVAAAVVTVAATIMTCGAAAAGAGILASVAACSIGAASISSTVATVATVATYAVAATVVVGVAGFAAADVQEVITDGKSNYLRGLGNLYEPIRDSLYFTSYMLGYAGQFAQPGWGIHTSGKADAPQKSYQYGKYTKITPNGNDVTIYNGRGQAILRYDYSHSHAGMQTHVHQFDWWKYNGKWRWNGKTGNVYPL